MAGFEHPRRVLNLHPCHCAARPSHGRVELHAAARANHGRAESAVRAPAPQPLARWRCETVGGGCARGRLHVCRGRVTPADIVMAPSHGGGDSAEWAVCDNNTWFMQFMQVLGQVLPTFGLNLCELSLYWDSHKSLKKTFRQRVRSVAATTAEVRVAAQLQACICHVLASCRRSEPE